MLPVASGEGSLVASAGAPPARAHRVNAHAADEERQNLERACVSCPDLDVDDPPARDSTIASRAIVMERVECDPLGDWHRCGGPESEVTVMMPVTITATVSPGSVTGCPGGSSATVVAAILGAPGGRAHHVVRHHQPRSESGLGGHVAVWMRRIGRVAGGDELLCGLLGRQLLGRQVGEPVVLCPTGNGHPRRAPHVWCWGRSATTAPKAINPTHTATPTRDHVR